MRIGGRILGGGGASKECAVEPFRPSALEGTPKYKSWRWCEVNAAISLEQMDKHGVNAVYENKAFQDIFEGVAMALQMVGKEYFKEEIKVA